MSNTRIANRFTSVLIAVVLLVALSLATAAPAAAAPTADPGAEVGLAWTTLISWTFSGWMEEFLDWVAGVWSRGTYTIDPDGQSAEATPPQSAVTSSWRSLGDPSSIHTIR